MGLEKLFHASVGKDPQRLAVVFGEQRVTYQCLQEIVNSYAAYLEKNTQVQDGVMILARNSIEQIALLLACFETGRIACPVNWRMSALELAGLMNSGYFQLGICDGQCGTLYADAKNLCDRELPAAKLEELPRKASCSVHREEQPEDWYAVRYFTSGSTGVPKSVLHNHRSLMNYARTYSEVSEWKPEDIYETQSNLFHLSGFSCMISLFVGGTLVLMDRFREEEFFGAMERERCTRISLVPTLISRCLSSGAFQKYDFSSVKKIVYGGSPLPMAQVQKTLAVCHCALEQAYGTTETCNISVLSGADHERAVAGQIGEKILQSAGKPIPGVEVRILNEEGIPMDNGIGEVAVKSPFLLSKVEGNIPKGFDRDGFYMTGDVGRVDENGYLYLIDRKNDMIVSGGENIYPREVENCLAHMVNDISTSAVIGVPDPVWGQRVVAFVVRYPNSTISEQDVIEFCREHIASYKKPREVIFLDRLPMNANRKACRPALREMYARWHKEQDQQQENL